VGAAANFNNTFRLSRGTYFAWANHDDLWDPRFLEACVRALDYTPDAVLAFTKSVKIDERGEPVAALLGDLGLSSASARKRLKAYHDLFRKIDKKKGWKDHEIEGLWIPIYGLMRANHLKNTPLIAPYISSDTILIELMLMRGRFIEINEALFSKRDHSGRSMRDSVPYQKRVSWFTGKKASKLLFPRWRLFVERLKYVSYSDLPAHKKIGCWSEMFIFYFRRPHEGKSLVKEILINIVKIASQAGGHFDGLRRRLPEKW
jgi:hypothetical protein